MQLRPLAILAFAATTLLSLATPVAAQTITPNGVVSAPSSPENGQQQKASAQSATPVRSFVYVGNYDSNDVSAYNVDAVTGALSPVKGSPFPTAAGPVSIVARADAKFLFVANSLASSISVYRIDSRGALEEVSGSPFETDGDPRELAINHSGTHLYVTSKDHDSISVFSIDAASGGLSAVPGSPFHAGHLPSGIAVGVGDKFVFVSHEADDTVASFLVDQKTGALTPSVEPAANTGTSPGKIALSPSGKELYVANTMSNSVSVFSVDPVRGLLTAVDGSPFGAVSSPGDLLATADGVGLFVGSSQAAGLAGIAINPAASVQAGKPFLAPAEAMSSDGTLVLGSDGAGRFLFTADANTNSITRYRVDPQTHLLAAGSGLSYATGTSPQAIAVANAGEPGSAGAISVSLTSGSLLTFSSTTGGVTLSAPAVNGGVTGCNGQVIQLAFSIPSIAVISTSTENPATSVCVPTGTTTAAFTVTTAANNGSATLTAFATGFTNGTTSLNVSLRTITLSLPFTNIGTGKTVTGSVTLTNLAPTGGVTIALASNATLTATVTASVTIAAGQTTAPFSVTGVSANSAIITASVASGGYTSSPLDVTVFPPGLTINLPLNAVVAPGQTLPYPISIGAAAASALSVTFATGGGPGTATISPNPVTIPMGATTPTTAPTITGGHIGPLTVTGSASGYASDTENATVQITLTFNPNTLSVETGSTKNLTLSASAVAPAGGFVITLGSTNSGVASVPSSITIPAGKSSVSVPVTGVGAGTTTIQATAPGAIAGSATVTDFAPPGITLRGPLGNSSFNIGENGILTLSGSLAQAAPAGNLTVKITTPTTSDLLLSTTVTGTGSHSIKVTVSAGSTSIPGFYAQATTVNSGTAVVTATAPHYSSGTATATFVPSGFLVQGGTSTTTLSGPSPVYVTFVQLDPTTLAYAGTLTLRPGVTGVTVKLKDTNTPSGIGSLTSNSIAFAAGNSQLQTSFQPNATGSGGTAVITFNGVPTGYSTPSNYQTTTYTVTAPNSSMAFCNGVSITGTGQVSLGHNSICAVTAQLAVAAPLGGRTVTLKSSNGDLLLSTSATAVGTVGPITLTIPSGASSAPQFFVQIKKPTGTANISETIPGYNKTIATVNFAPSGFIVQGGTTTTTYATASPVYVTFVQLDPTTLDYAGTLTLRPGLTAFDVKLKNTDTPSGVGTLGSNSIAFNSGDSQHQTTFQPNASGSGGTAVISFNGTPTGYAAPSNYATTTFIVNQPNSSLAFCNGINVTGTGAVSLGYNSTCSATAQLATAAPKGGKKVKLTSSDPTKLLLSTIATKKGTASITVNVPAGAGSAPSFYVQSLVNTGSATITETVVGYNSTTATVNFAPSGFIVTGGTSTTTFSSTSPVYVTFVQLDPTTLAYAGTLTLRPGLGSFNVGLTDSNKPVGTLGSTSIAFSSGDSQHQTTFLPTGTAAGTVVIGFKTTLTGYSTPSNYATTTFTVTAPNSSLAFCNGINVSGTGSVSLGFNSTCAATPELQTAAPTGGRTVTITSSDATKLLLSNSSTTVGTASITVNIAAGGSSGASFYAQSLVNKGSATITETVAGYNPTAVTVNFAPSGFIVQGGTTTTTYSAASPVYVTFVQLDPTTLAYAGTLTLRPGLTAPVNVGLKDTNTPTGTGVGSLGSTSIAFNSGNSQLQTTFQPAGVVGTAVISFSATPAGGYSAPSNYATTTFTVNTPNSSLAFCTGSNVTGTGSVSLGYDSICAATAQLAVPAPTGGRTVSLQSSSPNLLLSTSATAVGTVGPINLTIPAGSSSAPPFYVQTAASSGSATITETISGYNQTVATVNFTPSGFIVQGGTSTTTLSSTSPVYVTFVQLDPTTLNYAGTLTLRPGLSAINVGLTDTNMPTGVGSLGSTSIAFNSGNSQLQTTFQPALAGTAVIGFASTLTGFATPTNYATTTFTVTAPATSLQAVTVGNYMQVTTYGSLAVAAPTGGATVKVSAPSGSSILLSTSASAVGTASLSFNLIAGQSTTPTFYVQSQGGGAGTVNLTISSPKYANGTGVVTVYPSGFALQGSNFTTTVGDNPTTLTIVPAALDPTFLNIYQVQELVPNVQTLLGASGSTGTLQLTVESGTGVGQFSLNSVTFKGNDSPNFLTSSFEPLSAGTALITITSSTGFTNASTQITATVVGP